VLRRDRDGLVIVVPAVDFRDGRVVLADPGGPFLTDLLASRGVVPGAAS